jgi:hypothetical protein
MNGTQQLSLRTELMSFLPANEMSATASTQSMVTVIGAIDKNVDVLAQMQDAFNHFIQTGQVWALLVGLVLGYIFRSFTAY